MKERGTTISTARNSGHYQLRLEINEIGEGTSLPKLITTTLEMPKKKEKTFVIAYTNILPFFCMKFVFHMCEDMFHHSENGHSLRHSGTFLGNFGWF